VKYTTQVYDKTTNNATTINLKSGNSYVRIKTMRIWRWNEKWKKNLQL